MAVVAAPSAHAQPPAPSGQVQRSWAHERGSVSATANASALVLADRLMLTIRVEAERGLSVVWPTVSGTMGSFRIVSETETPASLSSKPATTPRVTTEHRFVLEPTAVGKAEIPAMEFRFRPPTHTGGAAGASAGGFSILTTAIPIEVESVVARAQPGDPSALRGVVPGPRGPSSRVWIGAAVAGVVAGCSLTAWAMARRRREPAADPILHLKVRLRRLDERAAAGTSAMVELCTDLSAALREYLQLRTTVPAIDLTTEELQPRLVSDRLTTERAGPLGELLTRCDLAKFAGDGPGAGRLREDIRSVVEFITLTETALDIERQDSRRHAKGGGR